MRGGGQGPRTGRLAILENNSSPFLARTLRAGTGHLTGGGARGRADARSATRAVEGWRRIVPELIRQEFTFSPDRAAWEDEGLAVQQDHITHVRLVIGRQRTERGLCDSHLIWSLAVGVSTTPGWVT